MFSESVVLLENKKFYKIMAKEVNPYSDGKASERIFEILERFV